MSSEDNSERVREMLQKLHDQILEASDPDDATANWRHGRVTPDQLLQSLSGLAHLVGEGEWADHMGLETPSFLRDIPDPANMAMDFGSVRRRFRDAMSEQPSGGNEHQQRIIALNTATAGRWSYSAEFERNETGTVSKAVRGVLSLVGTLGKVSPSEDSSCTCRVTLRIQASDGEVVRVGSAQYHHLRDSSEDQALDQAIANTFGV